MTPRMRTASLVKVVAFFAFIVCGLLALLVLHLRSAVVEVTNRTSHPLDSVTLHLEAQQFVIGILAPGGTRRTRIWPQRSGGIAVSHASPGGMRHAYLGYLNPWHGIFDGGLRAHIDRDSVTVRQRMDRRTLIPGWIEYSVPSREGAP